MQKGILFLKKLPSGQLVKYIILAFVECKGDVLG
jgi:hypothetical protein